MAILRRWFSRYPFATSWVEMLAMVFAFPAFSQDARNWVARYDGPSHTRDQARDVAVDSQGNIYVTGYSENVPGSPGSDFATIKYNSGGEELWVARYADPAGDLDLGIALGVDLDGNVIVTGVVTKSKTDADIVTIKYNPDGLELWKASFDGPARSFDRPYDLVIDRLGRVTIAGLASVSGSDEKDRDYVTLQYSSAGELRWQALYDGPAKANDQATALGIDLEGNVYVTGFSSAFDLNNQPRQDSLTIKYDPDGRLLWEDRFNEPVDGSDSTFALALDRDGNIGKQGYDPNVSIPAGIGHVYVTGGSDYGNHKVPNYYVYFDYLTIKYDADGKRLWAARHVQENGPDTGHAIAVDRDGSVYVTGTSTNCPDGVEEGVCRYPSKLNTAYDILTIKYGFDGQELWAIRYHDPRGGEDFGNAIALDRAGNVLVAGETRQSADGQPVYPDLIAIKYTPGGKQLWASRYNGPANYNDFGTAMVLDRQDNVYVAGGSEGIGTDVDFALVKNFGNSPLEIFIRGDATADGALGIDDPIFTLLHLFLGENVPCLDALDFDDSGSLDISDPIQSLIHQFSGGPEPVDPYPECGGDRTRDKLNCDSFPICV